MSKESIFFLLFHFSFDDSILAFSIYLFYKIIFILIIIIIFYYLFIFFFKTKMIGKTLIEKYQSFNGIKKQSQFLSKDIIRGRQMNNNNYKTTNIIPIQNNIKIKNLNNRIKLNSSNYSSDEDSYSSSQERKKQFFNEDNFHYLNKSEEIIFSSDDDFQEIEVNIKETLENEIEEILIQIYQKNFSKNKKIFSSRIKRNYIKKNKKLNNQNNLKLSLRQLNEKYNIYSLKILSKKIKEIINNYKEKLFENVYLSPIYSSFKKKKEEIYKNNSKKKEKMQNLLSSEKKLKKNNQIISPTTSTSSNQSDDFIINQINQFNCDKNYFSSILIQIKKGIKEHDFSKNIINELNHIKSSLKKSVFEIKNIFQYPLSLLKINFSIELIQLEAFNKIIIKNNLLFTILYHIRQYVTNNNLSSYLEILNNLQNDKKYNKEEMSKFDKLLKKKLKELNFNDNEDNNIKNEIEDYFLFNEDDYFNIDNNLNNNNNHNNSLSEFDNNNNGKYNEISEEKSKLNDLDIDELVKFIDNDENDQKKKRKKKNKNKKNKQIINNKEKEDNINNSFDENEIIERENFEKIYEKFKQDINDNTSQYFNFQKIKPKLNPNWIMKLYIK